MKNSYIVLILFHVDSMIGAACLKIFKSKISLGLPKFSRVNRYSLCTESDT